MDGLDIIVDESVADRFSLDTGELIRHATVVLSSFGIDRCEVNVVFIGDDRMAVLNESYRGKSGSTDVLSFNLSDDPGGLLEGEVYVSVDRAAEQAAAYGASTSEELVRLVTHGLLHLAGWTHDTPSDLVEMQEETERFVRSYFENGELSES